MFGSQKDVWGSHTDFRNGVGALKQCCRNCDNEPCHVIDLCRRVGFVLATLGADLPSGVEHVRTATRLVKVLKRSDLCLTGAGSMDERSLQGKVAATVTHEAS